MDILVFVPTAHLHIIGSSVARPDALVVSEIATVRRTFANNNFWS